MKFPRRYTEPEALRENEVFSAYAFLIGANEEKLKQYLEDVKDLNGQLPDGSFGRILTPEELSYLDGFKGETFKLYKRILISEIRARIRGALVENINGTPIRVRRWGTNPHACKKEAIAKTLQQLIPDFEIDNGRSLFTILTPGCGTGPGKGGKRHTHRRGF